MYRACLSMIALTWSATALAGDVGAHLGIVTPLASTGTEGSSSIVDNFVIGVPTGVGFALSDRVTLDLETVAFVDPDANALNFMAHPGIVVGLGQGYGAGARLAAEFSTNAYGATLIANKGFAIDDDVSWFVEAVLPLRVVPAAGGGSGFMATFAVHSGISL